MPPSRHYITEATNKPKREEDTHGREKGQYTNSHEFGSEGEYTILRPRDGGVETLGTVNYEEEHEPGGKGPSFHVTGTPEELSADFDALNESYVSFFANLHESRFTDSYLSPGQSFDACMAQCLEEMGEQ